MPELPEVETIVRELQSVLIGKKFWNVESYWSSVFLPSAEVVTSQIPGLRILDIQRRGKYIIFLLDRKMRLGIHLRMTGRLLWKKRPGREKFIRAIFHFTDATMLIFSDVRKFGRIWLYPEKDFEKETGITRLGAEPLHPDFSFDKFLQLLQGKKGALKQTLLRQDLLAGIGNIYADEACFKANLHPLTCLESLKKSELQKLYDAIQFCLNEGILHSGTSVSDFVGTRGKIGNHQKYLQVYGRKEDSCYVCLSPIQKIRVAGRGTFFCLKCQKR